MKKISAIIVALLGLALSGCGPGFPIMTREQEELVDNVNRLVKENETLKSRLSDLEGQGGIARLRGEIDAVKKTIADANLGVERLREEVASVKGSAEEGAHDREEIRNALQSANSSTQTYGDKLAAIESALRSVSQKLDNYDTASQRQEKDLSELREAVTVLDKKASALERSISAVKAETAPPASKEEGTKAAKSDDAETLYQKGYKETSAKEYSKATESFQKFLSVYPAHKYAVNAQYWLGEIYYAKGDWEMAILEFDKVVKKYPGSDKTAASLLKQGFAFEKLGSSKEARVLLREVSEKFPNSPEAAMAKKRLQALK